MAKKLVIRDQEFKAKETLGQWRLMRYANLHRSGDYASILSARYDFLTGQVEDPRALEAYLSVVEDITEEEFSAAIGALMTEYAERPTERPSSSPVTGKSTKGKSRVVSFSRGTVKAEEALPKDGQSAVS